jgi:nucleoside 2-deoxyribosyltransferase
MKTWYLAHQFVHRKEIKKIQKKIESQYKINLLNPFYDTGRDDIIKHDAGETLIRTDLECRHIVNDDLQWIRSCDGLLCILKPGDKLGSLMEIFYASKIMQKPVYLICNDKKIIEHIWIRALVFKIFRNMKEFDAYCIENELVQK